jgi:hypothetical protein
MTIEHVLRISHRITIHTQPSTRQLEAALSGWHILECCVSLEVANDVTSTMLLVSCVNDALNHTNFNLHNSMIIFQLYDFTRQR